MGNLKLLAENFSKARILLIHPEEIIQPVIQELIENKDMIHEIRLQERKKEKLYHDKKNGKTNNHYELAKIELDNLYESLTTINILSSRYPETLNKIDLLEIKLQSFNN